MQVFVRRVPRPNTEVELQVPSGADVLGLLRQLSVPPDAVVVLRQDTPVPADEPVREGDRLTIVNVYSGG